MLKKELQILRFGEPCVVVSVFLKSDLQECRNENVNFNIASPTASTQGADRFHVLDLRLSLWKGLLCRAVWERSTRICINSTLLLSVT